MPVGMLALLSGAKGAVANVQANGWLATRGGRIFVPFPGFVLTFKDGLAAGGSNESTVDLVAHPRIPGAPFQGSTELRGVQTNAGTQGASTDTAVPPGATGYYVVPEDITADQLSIVELWTPTGGAATVLGAYKLDNASSTAGAALSAAPWRPTPPLPDSEIRVTNADATNARPCWVYWRFDLLAAW